MASTADTTWRLLIELNKLCSFQTNEGKKYGPASNSELKRWCQQSCVEINHEVRRWDEEVPNVVWEVVLFPKSQRKRCTLFYDQQAHEALTDDSPSTEA